MARLFDDASTEYLSKDVTPPVVAAPLTMAAWFYTNDVTAERAILQLADKDVSNHWFSLEYRGQAGGKPIAAWARGTGADTLAATSASPSVNTWHHACGVFRSTTDRSAFLDGGNEGTDSTSHTVSGLDRITIGGYRDSTPGQYWSGRLAEVALWDIDLSDQEVVALASGVLPSKIRPENLVGYWPIWGVHSPEIDLSGQGNSLTLNGTSKANHAPVSQFTSNWAATMPVVEDVTPPPATPGTIGFISSGVETLSKTSYELWLTDDFGNRIAQLTTFLTLQASRVVNQMGFFNMTMPVSFDTNLIQPDRMVQLWRAPRGGRLRLWRIYFIRKWRFAIQGNEEVFEFGGPDTNDLLRRRIVAAFTGSGEGGKTDFADDMMKEIVTESIADGVAPIPSEGTRVWNDLSIASDLGLGPTITDSFAFDKLLTTSGQGVLPELAKAAREEGTEVFFDIVPNVITGNSATFQFQTFTGQPGQDHTSRVVFDSAQDNMINPSLEYDYTEEENYIYALGQGEGSNRNVQQVADSDRYTVSQWARIEGTADARSQRPDNAVIAKGNSKLSAGRPKVRFSAIPIDVEGTRFMRDWDYGDKVKARFRNIEFNTIIRAVTISVNENSEESIGARLDFES